MDDMMRRTLAEAIAQDDADLAASRAISQRQEGMMDEGEALYEDEESEEDRRRCHRTDCMLRGCIAPSNCHEDEEPSPRALPVVRS